MKLSGKVIAQTVNERGNFSRVKLVDPTDGLSQHLYVIGTYPIGSIVEIEVTAISGTVNANS